MDAEKEIKRISEKLNVSQYVVKAYWDDYVEHRNAGFPFGENFEGLRNFQRQKARNLFEKYLDEAGL